MTGNSFWLSDQGEDTIRKMLISCKGDMFRTAQSLGITHRELDSAIRHNPALQAQMLAIEKCKIDPEYEKLSHELQRQELDRLTNAYRLEGLQAIHELATMPLAEVMEKGSLADVKLRAAVALRGSDNGGASNSEASSLMHELNELYLKASPRIQSMRATVTVELNGSETPAEIHTIESVPLPR